MRKLLVLPFLALFLTGCVETEAVLTWHPDGRLDLKLIAQGEGLENQARLVLERLEANGFYQVVVSGDRIEATRLLKPAGWDRVSGLWPGRVTFIEPTTGLMVYRSSYVFFEDYGLEGELVPIRALGLPQAAALLAPPFSLKVQAPWPALEANAPEREGRTYVWRGSLTDTYDLSIRYRRYFPERVLAALGIIALPVLWRRLRRPPRG